MCILGMGIQLEMSIYSELFLSEVVKRKTWWKRIFVEWESEQKFIHPKGMCTLL
jgi:hypothetical protein